MNNLKFRVRVWDKKLKLLGNVSYIDFDSKKMIYHNGFVNYYVNFEDVEIMQSTGLFDKNDKEVFEGDIIATTKNKYEIIQGVTGLWKAVNKQSEHYLCLDDICLTAVIGNIYENEELIENENYSRIWY